MKPPLNVSELDALIEVSRTVNAHLDLDKVLKAVMAVTGKVMRVEASSLVLIDEETDDLIFHVAQGDKAQAVSQIRMQQNTGVVGWVIEHGEPVVLNDVTKDDRFSGVIDKATGFKTRSILCVPMTGMNGNFGAIEVLNRSDNQDFTDQDVRLCEAIAAQAAIAIENATLHKKIIQAERLAVVGQTVAGMAHCIKNVLNGIQGGAYMVDTGLNKENSTTVARGWEIVRKNSGFLQNLVHDMLTYSKERKPEYEPTDMNELAESMCQLLEQKAAEKGVAITFTGASDMGMMVVDPMGIRRALLNLISNAVDACEKEVEGKVEVNVATASDDTFTVTVSDSGCGMSEDDTKHLFEPFFSTKGSKGTGLGLPVTHKIIKEHDGHIEVDSAVGKGTSFAVILPVREVANHTNK
jgi:signal transduction histidine kinase